MTTPQIVLDRVGRVTPLGVRFWDAVTRSHIGDGLSVSAFRPTRPDRRHGLTLNHANTFTLQGIAPDAEFGLGDEAYWANLPPPKPWTIEVADAARRFLPFAFEAAAPSRGLFQWPCESPAEASLGVPLFSAPTRPIADMGVIRADVRDAAQFDPRLQEYAPAAWTLIEAWHDGTRIGRGLADDNGGLLLAWPYPEPIDPPLASPLSQRRALTAQSWTIELRAFYQPVTSPPGLPDLCTLLSQAPANLLGALSPGEPLTQVEAAYGVETVLRTAGLSVLLVAA